MASLTDYTFAVYDASGVPVAGLAAGVVWLTCVDVVSGLPTSPPTVSEVGGGLYSVAAADINGIHIAGIMDFGGSAGSQFRYQLYDSPTIQNGDYLVVLRDVSNVPVAGATASWSTCTNVVTGTAVAHPDVREMGFGLHLFPRTASAGQNIVGLANFGASVFPQYVQYSDQGSPVSTPATISLSDYPKMTLETLRASVRSRADMVNSTFVSDSELDMYINGSYAELYDLLVSKYENYYATSSTFVTDGTSDTYDLPGNFYKLIGVDLQTNASATANGWLTLTPYAFGDRNRYAYPGVQMSLGYVNNLRYSIVGDQLAITPRATAGQTIRLWYVPRLSKLIADAPTITVDSVEDNTTITVNGLKFTATGPEVPPGAYQFWSDPGDNQFTASDLQRVLEQYIPTIDVLSNTGDAGQPYVISIAPSVITSWSSSNTSMFALVPVTPEIGSLTADGVSGWLDYVIVDAAIKCLLKEESDAGMLKAEKDALLRRIDTMAANRDAGSPYCVRDSQASNGSFPWQGSGGSSWEY